MNCIICEIGSLESALITVTPERDGVIVLVKEVPATVCSNCGERYFDSSITNQLLALANRAFEQGTELEIVRLPLPIAA